MAFDEDYREMVADARDAIGRLLDELDPGLAMTMSLRVADRFLNEAVANDEFVTGLREDRERFRRAREALYESADFGPLVGPIADLERAFNDDGGAVA